MTLTAEQAQVKDEFVRVRGAWGPAWEAVLQLDPAFLKTYLDFSAVPWRASGHLEPKVKELIYIAVDAAATHLYEPGIRQHIAAALDQGATGAEVMEVLELTSTLGIHACNIGVPLLLEAMAEAGHDTTPTLDERRTQLKEQFSSKRGYWNPFWDGLLQLDPDLFEAYTAFSSVPWESGPLEPKVKELIYTAFDASATHLYVPGLKQHIANALGHGATVGEVMEVLEIVSVIGIHCATVAAPILLEELTKREMV
jgi:alkylhydroperoxidase/carboxymuconolactone decarboxylase family protein YurZ